MLRTGHLRNRGSILGRDKRYHFHAVHKDSGIQSAILPMGKWDRTAGIRK